jgi:hypothetical protein
MYLLAIGWLYVALMMAAAEALHPQGSVLGAVFTFVLYGLAPVALSLYLLATPMRRRARRKAEAPTAPHATDAGAMDPAPVDPAAADTLRPGRADR